MLDRSVTMLSVGRNVRRIIPEIQSVYLSVIEPQPYTEGVIDAFARACIQRPATGNEGSAGGRQGTKRRHHQLTRIDVGGKRFSPYRYIHHLVGFVFYDGR